MNVFEDVPKYYSEKKWFKTNGSEETVTGYSLRGGQMLKHAVNGLKESLQRGVIKTIDETHIRVLDTRKVGVAFEIEVETMFKSERGNAMIKLHGPYNQKDKKDNVIMITKIKRNHEKFVTILAENIVKPLIDKFVKDEREDIEEVEQEDNKYCTVCEKVFKSPAGLKTHITKKHKQTDVGKVSTEKESLLNETCNISETEKEYSEMCNQCDFIAIAEKKYLVLKLMTKHKKDRHYKFCGECEYKAKNLQDMKRHERDVHDKITGSTSPPAKKERNFSEVIDQSVEMMETEENVLNLSVQLEEMELEKMDIDEELRIEKELSKKMDKKVKERQEKIDECDRKWAEKKLAKEKSKKDNENEIIENERKTKKIQKQKSKDQRKRDAKKNKPNYGTAHNIKEVPNNCKKFVNEGDKIYEVPGNGACAMKGQHWHILARNLAGFFSPRGI